MTDYTRPTGADLRSTQNVTDGDRIADALRCLKACPPPAWLHAAWVLSHKHHDNFTEDTDTGPEPVAGVPPHPGIIPADAWPPVFLGRGPSRHSSPHEVFLGGLTWALGNGLAPRDWCPCGFCIPTGMPPALLAELREGLEGQRHFGEAILRPPWASMVSYLAHDAITMPRAVRAACLPLYAAGGPWAPLAAWVTDPAEPCDGDGFSHYVARMSDAALAHSAAVLGLSAGLLPIEVYAALAEGFTYPVPEAGTPAWDKQRAHEERAGTPYLASATRHAADAATCGYPPWEDEADPEGADYRSAGAA